MKNKLILFFILTACCSQKLLAQDKLGWWKDAKFGLFLHWGLYTATQMEWNSRPAKANEHLMWGEKIPLTTYKHIADDYNPERFNAEQWVKDAKNAGMKYIVITAKHHEGYAMYASKVSSYNIVKTTPFARDPMKELATACKKYDMKLGFYYSLGWDWEDPDALAVNNYKNNNWDFPNDSTKVFDRYFRRKVLPQVTELLSNYGPIAVIWFDIAGATTPAESKELRALINKLQPGCIINSRVGNNDGDYQVLEQKIDTAIHLQPWESCITMSGKWGYSKYDHAWKSPELLVRNLIEIVCKGGNLLLNVGPTNTGEFPPESRANLAAIGAWMKINGEAVYGTHPWHTASEQPVIRQDILPDMEGQADDDVSSKKIRPDLYFNAKDKTVYLFARSWRKPQLSSTKLAGIKIKNITCLGSPEKIHWSSSESLLTIDMPRQLPKCEVPVYVFRIATK
ncbi:MAG: alpha-L-fucosidase [Bacteroidota bacterium]